MSAIEVSIVLAFLTSVEFESRWLYIVGSFDLSTITSFPCKDAHPHTKTPR